MIILRIRGEEQWNSEAGRRGAVQEDAFRDAQLEDSPHLTVGHAAWELGQEVRACEYRKMSDVCQKKHRRCDEHTIIREAHSVHLMHANTHTHTKA